MTSKEQLTEIAHKLDNLDTRLDNVDKHMAVYNEQLKEHIRRTNVLEEEFRPVRDHVIGLRGTTKSLGMLGVVLGVILSILKLTGKL